MNSNHMATVNGATWFPVTTTQISVWRSSGRTFVEVLTMAEYNERFSVKGK